MDYPKREPFFMARVIRLMTKSAAGMEIGPDGVALVAVIVCQEDACRYTRPVNFWNTQLATIVGLRDPEALRRVRERCVKAGWLKYLPGNKRQPARYYADIPHAVSLLPDGSCDESPREYGANPDAIQTQSCRESAENLPRICRESAENRPPSSPIQPYPMQPYPIQPTPNIEPPAGVQGVVKVAKASGPYDGDEADSVGPLFSLKSGLSARLSVGEMTTLTETFPDVRVDAEVMAAASWTAENPKRAPKSGVFRFVLNWISRNHPKPQAYECPPNERPSADAIAAARELEAQIKAGLV